MQQLTKSCKNCRKEVQNNYCSNCGLQVKLKRVNGSYIFREIIHTLNFEKGFLYTIRQLIFQPGQSIQKFLFEDRSKLVKPLLFIIICSLIYTLAKQYLHFEDAYISFNDSSETARISIQQDEKDSSTLFSIFDWIQSNYGYSNILIAMFMAFWIKILFRKFDFNYFEIMILLCYVLGIEMLIFSMFGLIESAFQISVMKVGGFLGILYTSWATGRFFNKQKKSYILKGFLSYLLGLISFSLIAILTGLLFDILVT